MTTQYPKKVLLVYPKYPDTFWSFKHVMKFISSKSAFPPLGLLTIASMLPKSWDLRLIDLNVSNILDKDIAWADMVFMSAMIVQRESCQNLIERCHALETPVVAGGPLFTTSSQDFPDVDHFILGEAEVTLPKFLADLEKGNADKVYASNEKPDITKTITPMWSLINFKDYATMPIQYSRGCPFNCEFCDIIVMNGRVPRTKTPEQMLIEFQTLYNAGWRGSVFIVDDNFIGNKMKTKEMLHTLIKWQKSHHYPFRFFTEASVNLADDDELLELMSTANFYKVFLGIETPSVAALNECGKFQNAGKDIVNAVQKIHRKGMQVMAGFIVGFDTDTEKIFDTQIRFIQEMGVVTAMVGLLTALPQTRLWHRLKAEGRLLDRSTGGNTDATLNFVPKMSKEALVNGYKKILTTIYSPKTYYERVHTFVNMYQPTVRAKLGTKDIKAFLRSIWKIGILSSSRYLYWKLVLKTFFTKRKALAMAVELAIIGLHFENVTKRIAASINI